MWERHSLNCKGKKFEYIIKMFWIHWQQDIVGEEIPQQKQVSRESYDKFREVTLSYAGISHDNMPQFKILCGAGHLTHWLRCCLVGMWQVSWHKWLSCHLEKWQHLWMLVQVPGCLTFWCSSLLKRLGKQQRMAEVLGFVHLPGLPVSGLPSPDHCGHLGNKSVDSFSAFLPFCNAAF